MIRVLHVVDKMDRAGQETFIMNVYRQMDRSKIQFDFLQFQPGPADFDEEILALGGRIHHATGKGKDLRQSMAQITAIVRENDYHIVHRHFSNASMFLELWAARRGGADCLIAHSHNTSSRNVKQHYLFRYPLYRISNWHLACAEDAGHWMFGDRAFHIIPNGIDATVFRYDPQASLKIREELGIEADRLVFGHVGRFNEVKNHAFILQVFKEIVAEVPDAILLLAGDGTLRPAMEQWTKHNQLDSNVRFLGVRSDIPALMSAMNLFLMPSLYEGLPVTLVEAQSTGLPCLVSDVVTEDIKITPCVEFLNLSEPARLWATRAIEMSLWPRQETSEAIKRSGYDIRDVAATLAKLYTKAEEDRHTGKSRKIRRKTRVASTKSGETAVSKSDFTSSENMHPQQTQRHKLSIPKPASKPKD